MDELWHLVQSKRGFESSPSVFDEDKDDELRRRPGTIKPDPQRRGARLGHHLETFGAIQIVDKDGRLLAIGADFYDTGPLRPGEADRNDKHAEPRILRALGKAVDKVPDGSLIGLVDQAVCDRCGPKLEAFMREKELRMGIVYFVERQSLLDSGKMTKPKYSSRTSLQELKDKDGKPIQIKYKESFKLVLRESQPGGSASADAGVQWEIGRYTAALVRGHYSGRRVYTEVYENQERASQPATQPSHRGRLVKYVVHGPYGDKGILIPPGRERAAQLELLAEVKAIAAYYGGEARLPLWLAAEGVEFCKRPTVGLHRFGKAIEIRGSGRFRAEHYKTKEQLIHVANADGGTLSLEFFFYEPEDRSHYEDDLHYRASQNWNFQMYHYIELKNYRPKHANETLKGVQMQMIKEIMEDMAGVDRTDAIKTGQSAAGELGPVAKELAPVVKAIFGRH